MRLLVIDADYLEEGPDGERTQFPASGMAGYLCVEKVRAASIMVMCCCQPSSAAAAALSISICSPLWFAPLHEIIARRYPDFERPEGPAEEPGHSVDARLYRMR